jgi:hypothetical protein
MVVDAFDASDLASEKVDSTSDFTGDVLLDRSEDTSA